MDLVSIKLLEKKDIRDLLYFEIQNREYFNEIGINRPEGYYEYDNFKDINISLLENQEKSKGFFYLVLDKDNHIIGRINLLDVEYGFYKKANLDYKIGKRHQNKGYGSKAVKLVLAMAKNIHNLHRIEASTFFKNKPSQIILIKNDFDFVGKYSKYYFNGEEWEDKLLFEKILDWLIYG